MVSDFAFFLTAVTFLIILVRSERWLLFALMGIFMAGAIFGSPVSFVLIVACLCYGAYAIGQEDNNLGKGVIAGAYLASLMSFPGYFGLVWPMTMIGLFIYFVSQQEDEPLIRRAYSPDDQPLVFVGSRMAVAPTIASYSVPDGYRLACLYFGTGLIDRTHTLDHGFPYEVLDPIPDFTLSSSTYSDASIPIDRLCQLRAEELVRTARTQDKGITILWSGGIDSTAACIALMAQLHDEPERLQIAYSFKSIFEYWNFYWQFVLKHKNKRRITNVTDVLREDRLIVTGEHGDQLFGSMKAIRIDPRILHEPWVEVFPHYLSTQFATERRAEIMLDYLRPQIAAAPVPITSVYELLWWLNFSMKWQAVTLRMPASLHEAEFVAAEQRLHHFYRTEDFQIWALDNADKRIRGTDWSTYKWPLKDYIYQSTGHKRYYMTKTKAPSLKGMAQSNRRGYAVAVDADRNYLAQAYNRELKDRHGMDLTVRGGGGSVVMSSGGTTVSLTSIHFDDRAEGPLWADVEGDDE